MPQESHHAFIRRRAQELGFTRLRVAPAGGAPGIERYDAFLAAGRHADMEWMARGREPRAAPEGILPSLRSVVVLGLDYGWPPPPDPGGLTGRVSRYAGGRDYHNLATKRLRRLTRELRARGVGCAWSVDSRPVIERAWAERAGVGFLGKNCCAIVPGQGSWFFLATLMVDVELPPDTPLAGQDRLCGRCSRCLDACPTGALLDSGQLDARLCISYLTIEHRGAIPEVLRPALGRWVFGCDDCQAVCPHNHAPPTGHPDLAPRNAWLDLPALLRTPDEALMARFQGTPIRRAGAVGLKRNAAIVLGNIGDPAARPALEVAARHADPIVTEHAEWALSRL